MRAAVWECRITLGMSTKDTAEYLKVTPGTVYSHMRAVIEEAREHLHEDVERWKLEQNARYDHIYGEAIGAWEESKKERVRKNTRSLRQMPKAVDEDADAIDPIPPSEENVDELKVMRESQVGDPRYLAAAVAALQAQGKLWGFNAPEQHDHNVKGVVVNVDGTDAVRAAEQAFRDAKFKPKEVDSGDRRYLQAESSVVVSEVRLDHIDEGGESTV